MNVNTQEPPQTKSGESSPPTGESKPDRSKFAQPLQERTCCNTYEGLPHTLSCPKVEPEELRRQAIAWQSAYEALHARFMADLIHRREQVTFWQGKFTMVKNENNVLRRRVRVTQGKIEEFMSTLGTAMAENLQLRGEVSRMKHRANQLEGLVIQAQKRAGELEARVNELATKVP